ncbi:MAG: hypothetical protein IPK82_09290 [Polyangiaceae bacterium]|nr:hypothetical protein [Polyangiaceae bacterium]
MDQDGNPIDTQAPDLEPKPEPPPPPIDDVSEPAPDPNRLSKQVPIGLLFLAATAAVLFILGIVAAIAFATLKN